MGSSAQPTLRVPLLLLAVANLAVLGLRIWPWQDVINLPVNGSVAIDPAVSLVGYMAIIFWLADSADQAVKKAMGTGTMLGILGGALLVAEIFLSSQASSEDGTQAGSWAKGLFVATAIVWGLVGLRGARVAGTAGIGMLSAAWSAMVSCLIVSSALLGQFYLAGPAQASQDTWTWKKYEGLAIGNPATQALVHSLNSITFFLLVGPLVGAAAGLVFALFGNKSKG